MRRALGVLVLLAGVVRADTITPPADWVADLALLKTAGNAKRLPATGMSADVVVAALRPQPPAGAVLYVTRYVAEVPAARRDAIASAELAELAAAMRRQGAGVVAESTAQKADPAAKQLEASVRWRDQAAGLVASARVVIAADAKQLQIVKGECMLAAEAPAALAKSCDDALATLRTTVTPDQRVPLAIVAAEPEPETPHVASEPARLDDGSRAVLPPMPVRATREPDRRPMYVGGGLVVLAVVFYLNRRRRERFEDEEPAPAADEDGQDLHAAAREEDKS